MRHGYFACVSYVDKLVGDILDELVRLNRDGNTMVVLWGDHGFNLGEHGFWGKHNLVRGSVHIIRAPGITRERTSSDALVESVDLFPTLVSLAGLPAGEELTAQWDGVDLTPLLRGVNISPRDAVYTRWQAGDNVVTPRFSYTQYGDYREGRRRAVSARMLFDRWLDPGEHVNVVDRQQYLPTVNRLSGQLHRLMEQAAKDKARGASLPEEGDSVAAHAASPVVTGQF
jgi:iduronate 2-sulfatase